MSPVRLLIVGHGRMGRLVESLGPEAGVRDRRPRRHRQRRPSGRLARGGRGDRLFDRGGGAGQRPAAGRARHAPRHRHDRLAGPRSGGAARDGGRTRSASSRRRTSRWASICSWRWPRAPPSCSPRGRSSAPGFTSCITRQARRAVGHGARDPRRRCSRRATICAIDVASTRAGSIPGHAHGRVRQPGRDDHADPHGARPHRLRARRARGGAVGARPARLVHDARRVGVVVGTTSHDDRQGRAMARPLS